MPIICPTITVETSEEYNAQVTRVESFARRIHIDIADGLFAPRKLLALAQIYLPGKLTCDIHMMVTDPTRDLMTLISLEPNLVIVHAESEGNPLRMIDELQKVGIKAGVALLADTTVEDVAPLLTKADHALVFGGHLGYQGGQADLSHLSKVRKIRHLWPSIEIGWDGGVNADNAKLLVEAGVDVLNVGGFIQHAANPEQNFAQLGQAF